MVGISFILRQIAAIIVMVGASFAYREIRPEADWFALLFGVAVYVLILLPRLPQPKAPS